MNRTPSAPALLLLLLARPGAAAADSRLEKTFRLEPGGRFRLKTDLGGITLTGRAGSGATVVVTSPRDLDDLLHFSFEESSGSVTVVARRKHVSWFGNRKSSVRYEVQVPAETAVDLDTSGGAIKISGLRRQAKLDTSGGAIEARDLSGDLEAHTSGGGISLERIRGRSRVDTSGGGIEARELDGAIEAQTSGGPIELDRVSGDIRAHTSGGGIRIEKAGGRVEADTSGGGIEADFAPGNGRGGSLESSGGGIHVRLDPAVDLDIEASGNSVRTELPLRIQGEVSRRRLSGSLGKGGSTLRISTSGGSVHIRAL